jgi:hypothetical protein
MANSPKIDFFSSECAVSDAEAHSRRTADRVYQGLTLAAMVLLLASLWVF